MNKQLTETLHLVRYAPARELTQGVNTIDLLIVCDNSVAAEGIGIKKMNDYVKNLMSLCQLFALLET